MEAKRLKLESNMMINNLLDECFEEIFTKLTGKEQLTARIICKRWNKLLLECRRLLPTTVGISLEFKEIEDRASAIEILSSLQSSPTLKVFKVSFHEALFVNLPFPHMEAIEPTQYFEQLSFESVEELIYLRCCSDGLNILNILLGKMGKLKTLTLLNNTHGRRHFQSLELDQVPHGSLEKLILCDKNQYLSIEYTWQETVFKNISNLCEGLPNLKSIVGVAGYNEKFYEKFAHLIECPVFEINDENFDILQNSELQLKELRLFQVPDLQYDSTSFWQCLNKKSTLETVHLVYVLQNYLNGGEITLPPHNYSKVKHIRLEYITKSRESLQQVLKQLRNLISLHLIYNDDLDIHFTGHEPFPLPFLQYSTVSLPFSLWTCPCCVDSLTKSLTNVKSLQLIVRYQGFIDATTAIGHNIIQSIGENIPGIRELTMLLGPQRKTDYYMLWPQTTNLEKFVWLDGRSCNKIESMVHFCNMCPNMKYLELQKTEPFDDEILEVLLGKLKFLEYVKFDNSKIYRVTYKGGKRCFTIQ